MDNWYDQKKVDAMGFDETEWSKTTELLDDPDISDDEKELILERYTTSLLKEMGVKL